MTLTGDVQYDVNIRKKEIIPKIARQEETKNHTQTHHVYTHVKSHKENIRAEETHQQDILLAQKTCKGDNTHRITSGDLMLLKREYRTSQTPGGGKHIEAPYTEKNKNYETTWRTSNSKRRRR